MKKLLIIILTLALLLTGCGEKEYTKTFEAESAEKAEAPGVGAAVLYEELMTDFADEAFLSAAHNAGWGELPLYKLESLEELKQFEGQYGEKYQIRIASKLMYLDGKYQTIGEEFFDAKLLLLVYDESSSSCQYAVSGLSVADGRAKVGLYCRVKYEVPHNEDMVGYLRVVSVDRDSVKGCTEFDAFYSELRGEKE